MSLTDTFREYFSGKACTRGDAYFRQGRVTVRAPASDGAVTAHVRGSQPGPYDVVIYESAGGELDADCDCPAAHSYDGYCKHIWATLRAIDKMANGGARDQQDRRRFRSFVERLEAEADDHVDEHDEVEKEDGWDEDDVRDLPPPADVMGQLNRWLGDGRGRGRASGSHESDWSAVGGILKNAAGVLRSLRPTGQAAWRQLIDVLDQPLSEPTPSSGVYRSGSWKPPFYVLEVETCLRQGAVYLSTYTRKQLKNGGLGVLRSARLGPVRNIPPRYAADRAIRALLGGASELQTTSEYYGYAPLFGDALDSWCIDSLLLRALLPYLNATGRFQFRLSTQNPDPAPVVLDDGPPWQLVLALKQGERRDGELNFELRRGEQRCGVGDVSLLLAGEPGFCLIDDTLCDLETFGCPVSLVRHVSQEPIRVRAKDVPEAARVLSELPTVPLLSLPGQPELSVRRDVTPRGQLELTMDNKDVFAQVSYVYDDVVVPAIRAGRVVIDAEKRRQIVRNPEAEAALEQDLRRMGFKDDRFEKGMATDSRRVPDIVRTLCDEGWTVLADGGVLRRPAHLDLEVTSGIDWFDVGGTVTYDDLTAPLPDLLKALRSGQKYVRLGDGSWGMLPEEWLGLHGAVLDFGRIEGGKLRFHRTQVLLIDELLAQQPAARFDAEFAAYREKVRAFEGIRPMTAPGAFVGELRPYQQVGLGWFEFLDQFAWGGCLADDMGLGKTVQVLAWLMRRANETPRPTSLAVVPRSVVFNWLDEARKFAPSLRVVSYHGNDRHELLDKLHEYDLVVTTYHTLRVDVADFIKTKFDYVILDEAQAIKNPKAQSAKAVRLLTARRRLALTGTPVENRLADLWSIFDFLNPGMLGTVNAFREAFDAGDDAEAGRSERLRRAIRPFLLRRTKDAVAPELPAKTEETLYCEMTPGQAKRYAELREYYRAAVLGKVAEMGLARAKIHVLEALLRLRQAACHPALLDSKIKPEDSGKMDALLPMIQEVTDGGHKVLVFSQFTSFLALVQKLLDAKNVTYEYLDGKTRDRKSRIDRFQNDPDCKLFLISLKAGGFGLNLTAADYVFILDPWWNPAVEAQAIDRTHRIGQDKKVFAYRLISKGSVEEKILELQSRKRDLAASIITEASSLIAELTREDLELLLS